MNDAKPTRRWSEVYRLNVVDPGEGKTVGQIDDFFFQAGANAIPAFRVRTRLYGDYTLPIYAIKSVGTDAVIITNEQALIKAEQHYPTGRQLLSHKVVSENGNALGYVKEIWISVEPTTAMYIAAFEIAPDLSARSSSHRVTADSVARYGEDTIVIHDQIARRLR